MKTVVTTISNILDSSNKRACLSVLRAMKRCFDCDKYIGNAKYGVKECESKIINDHYNHLITLKEEAHMEYTKVIGDIDEAIQLL